ncbi:energy-coupling factor ABC transporter ATP-binding protein [Paenirhodobacter sp.]|uniref:energy-coupling factor ABC transporter ATP-binding protein n=1 Tax=Paenirhodobacter sp. TaxID=1965326 RepID=UPI003B40F4E6
MSLCAEDLGFAWPGQPPLFAGLSLRLDDGARLAVLGGNGSGKSTLGRCLAGFLPVTGRLMWAGHPWAALPPAERAQAVQYLGQRPHLQLSGRGFTLREEIAFGPENLGLPVAEIRARVGEAMDLLGLSHLAERDCHHLSGGETQRAALAGALAMRPRLLILDEPMTDLDRESRDALAAHLRDLPMTVIFLDIGWHGWMEGLVARHLLLDGGRFIGPMDTGALLAGPLPERILRPEP